MLKICAVPIFIFFFASFAVDPAVAMTCENLVSLKLSHTTITAVQSTTRGRLYRSQSLQSRAYPRYHWHLPSLAA